MHDSRESGAMAFLLEEHPRRKAKGSTFTKPWLVVSIISHSSSKLVPPRMRRKEIKVSLRAAALLAAIGESLRAGAGACGDRIIVASACVREISKISRMGER